MRRISTLICCLLYFGIFHFGIQSCNGKGESVPPPPELQSVAGTFREYLKSGDWNSALRMCTHRLQRTATFYPSNQEFFLATVPVSAISETKMFPCSGGARWDDPGQVTEFYSFIDFHDPISSSTLRWGLDCCLVGNTWNIDFSDLPLETWSRMEVAKEERLENEHEIRLVNCAKAAERVHINLIPEKTNYKIGEPIMVRIDLVNNGILPFTYDSQQIDVNGTFIVTDPAGSQVKYTGGSFQTFGGERVIEPGQTVVLRERREISKQYQFNMPGKYNVKHQGHDIGYGPDISLPSNEIELELQPR